MWLEPFPSLSTFPTQISYRQKQENKKYISANSKAAQQNLRWPLSEQSHPNVGMEIIFFKILKAKSVDPEREPKARNDVFKKSCS